MAQGSGGPDRRRGSRNHAAHGVRCRDGGRGRAGAGRRGCREHDGVAEALAAFTARRFERARMVVENSVRIGEIEMAGRQPDGRQRDARRHDAQACSSPTEGQRR